jgi:CRISPR-associated protein Csb2
LASPQERADFLRADLVAQIKSLCADLDNDAIAQTTITPVWDSQCVFHIPSHDARHELRPIQFKRFRSKPDDDGVRRLAGAFRMTFPLEVQGPMVLGWSSHFGLGLFAPAVSASTS